MTPNSDTIDPAVLQQIDQEVKRLGNDSRALHDSMRRDLEMARQLATEAKGYADAQIAALTTSSAAKLDELEKSINRRLDEVSSALLRTSSFNPGGQDERSKRQAEAIEFKRMRMALRDELKQHTIIDPASVSIDSYDTYCKAWLASLRKDKEALSYEEHKALTEGSDVNGGFLVPAAQSSRILGFIYESSPIRQIATVETIGSDRLEFLVDEGEFDDGWVGETPERAETNTSQLGGQSIPVHEQYAQPKASQRLLEDASINIENWIGMKLSERFARREATAFVSGNGVLKPRGLLSYPDWVNGTYSRGRIRRIKSGAAAELTADKLKTLPYELKDPFVPNARWLMKRTTLAAIMVMKDGNGQYLWQPGLQANTPNTLCGYPVTRAEDMPVVGAGTLPIAFGDFRQGYTIVDRLGISTIRDNLTSKPWVKFYSRRRLGGDVTNFEAFVLVEVGT